MVVRCCGGPDGVYFGLSEMRSEGRNLDLWDHSPQRMLDAWERQLEQARIDPSFYGVVREDRIKYYESKVEELRAICTKIG
mgnify:CR=1 FL=1